MREIYLVDKNSRLERILSLERGSYETEIPAIGIGFFNCQKNSIDVSAKGVTFSTSPLGLRSELLHEILAGRHSPLSQDMILFGLGNQANGKEPLLQRWLLVGLQSLGDLLSQNIPLTQLNLKILESRTLSSAVDTLLTGVFGKIADIKTNTLVFHIDSSILVDFFFSNLGRVPFGLGLSDARFGNLGDLSLVEREICTHRVAEEVIRWVALNSVDQLVVFKCENSRHLHGLTSISRLICTSRLNRGIAFRL